MFILYSTYVCDITLFKEKGIQKTKYITMILPLGPIFRKVSVPASTAKKEVKSDKIPSLQTPTILQHLKKFKVLNV